MRKWWRMRRAYGELTWRWYLVVLIRRKQDAPDVLPFLLKRPVSHAAPEHSGLRGVVAVGERPLLDPRAHLIFGTAEVSIHIILSLEYFIAAGALDGAVVYPF